MKHDWKKHEKELCLPKAIPVQARFVEESDHAPDGVAYAIEKMSPKM